MNTLQRLLALVTISLPLITAAQKNKTSQLYTPGNQTFVLSMNGQAMLVNKYANLVSGTPYLIDSWQDGKLIIGDNHAYIPLTFKLNLLDNTLHFRDSSGREMVTSSRIKELVIPNVNYGDQHFTQVDAIPDQHNAGSNVWVQVLANGKVSLYKYIRKQLVETRPYGASSVEQRINDQEFFYLGNGGNLTRIKKTKDIPEALTEKKTELEQYINNSKLPEKNPASLQQVVEYYNQLFSKE